MKGFILAGASSGSGKTTVSMGLMAAFKKRGLVVQPFKVGPDFIDPGYHAAICGRPCINLDSWIMPEEYIIDSFQRYSEGADMAIVEGVMGLFDGGEASSAQIARILDLPIVLVLDARGMAETAGAILYGLKNYMNGLNIAGAIINRVGSTNHYKMISEAISGRTGIDLLGYIKKDEAIKLEERHLGLITAIENRFDDRFIEVLIRQVEDGIDLEALIRKVKVEAKVKERPSKPQPQPKPLSKKKARLAVAYDEAFSFYYQDNLDMLKSQGAEISYFSPLKDNSIPDDVDGIYIGGGYPELYAGALEKNISLKKEIMKLAEESLPIYAECGGMIYLSSGIVTDDNRFYKMAGLIPFRIKMDKRVSSLGYREVELLKDCMLGEKGDKIRGHEFHYSRLDDDFEDDDIQRIEYLYKVVDKRGGIRMEGFGYKNLLASYIHLHFASNRATANSFVEFLSGGRA